MSAEFASSRIESLATRVGTFAFGILAEIRGVYSLLVRTLYYIPFGRRERGATVRQMYEMGNKSLFFVCITLGFIGMIMVFQAGLQVKRMVPDYTMLGATFLQFLVRDIAASISALMLATRIGAGIAAELGSMVVTEQIDALRMCAADPIDFLVAPRFLASLVTTMALTLCAGLTAYIAGGCTAYFAFDVPYYVFLNTRLVGVGDLVTGFAKCLAYGATIPIVAAYSGLGTTGGSEGVGWATTKAVVVCSLAIIIENFLISTATYFIFG
ncbi:MAG: ABC transporter permease [Polyangiaceae bacterium]|nr:ABC transporter permease [Polyangiaceae bacterium]